MQQNGSLQVKSNLDILSFFSIVLLELPEENYPYFLDDVFCTEVTLLCNQFRASQITKNFQKVRLSYSFDNRLPQKTAKTFIMLPRHLLFITGLTSFSHLVKKLKTIFTVLISCKKKKIA